jgi:uncharacterized peroxidase-related enzyme
MVPNLRSRRDARKCAYCRRHLSEGGHRVTFIQTMSDEDARSRAAEMFEEDLRDDGYVWNLTRVFAYRPEVHDAWRGLSGSIKAAMGVRRYELATLAAARQLRSSYCCLAHGKVLRDRLFDVETVRAIALDHHTAGLSAAEVAAMDFAERVAGDAGTITAEYVDELRAAGLTDEEILDVALAAAARCFFSKVLDAMGVEPDAAYRSLEPDLQEALTVGRAIAPDLSRF